MAAFFTHFLPTTIQEAFAFATISRSTTAPTVVTSDNGSFHAHLLSLHCIVLWVVVIYFLVAVEAAQREEEEEEEEAIQLEDRAAIAHNAESEGGCMQSMLGGRKERLLQGSARARDWAIQRKAKKNSHQAGQQESKRFSGHQKCLQEVIGFGAKAMRSADNHGIFLDPVTDAIAPGYSIVIKEPMCIRVIEDKAAKMEYRHLSEYEHDVHLMFDNCIKYNNTKEGNWLRNEAKRQEKVWESQIMPQVKDLQYKKGYW